mmetsp:Transcript_63815/g.75532  ORF Transcript_63815/g.75532 Transcript_63815/m.75532 type:complete len:259 (-) Transcript_63815:686-1462(-)
MVPPRGRVISERCQVRIVNVVLVLRHAPPLDLLVPIGVNVISPPGHSLVVAVFEQDRVSLFRSDLGDAGSHETGTEDTYGCHGRGRCVAERVLFHGGHAFEDANEGFAFFGLGQFDEGFSFVFVFGSGVVETVLDAVYYRVRSGILSIGILVHHFLHLLPHHVPTDGSVLHEPIHPTLLLLLYLQTPIRQLLRDANRHALQYRPIRHQIHQPHLLRFVHPHFFPRQHHIHRRLQSHHRMQILRPAKSRKQTQFHLRQT